jgi:hypothetical protein
MQQTPTESAWPTAERIGGKQTHRRVRRVRLLHVTAVGPAMLLSAMITLTVTTLLLPSGSSSAVLGALAVASWLTVTPGGERAALRVLRGARRLSSVECHALAAVMTDLCRLGLGPPIVELYVGRPARPVAEAHGRRSVVMTPTMLQAAVTGRLPHDEIVAVLAHEGVTLRSRIVVHDLAISVWCLPWQVVAAVGRPTIRLLGVFWKLRAGVFAVAIWQALFDPRAGSSPAAGAPTAIALSIGLLLTYSVPVCTAHWESYVCGSADVELVRLNLGDAMATFLRRMPSTPSSVRRGAMLSPPAPPSTTLGLVSPS